MLPSSEEKRARKQLQKRGTVGLEAGKLLYNATNDDD